MTINDERREDDLDRFGPEPHTPREGRRSRAPIDPTNKFAVGASATELVVRVPPVGALTRADAMNLAAWLVVVADTLHDGSTEASFDETLHAVLNSGSSAAIGPRVE